MWYGSAVAGSCECVQCMCVYDVYMEKMQYFSTILKLNNCEVNRSVKMKFRPSEIRMMQETRKLIKIRGLSGLNIACIFLLP